MFGKITAWAVQTERKIPICLSATKTMRAQFGLSWSKATLLELKLS